MNTCPACGGQYPDTVRLCARDGTVLESASPEDLQLGKVLDGKYRLDAFVSHGGMGSVYRATHVMLDKLVAVKLIKPELVPSPDIVRRFQREARAASNLNDPNIVAVYDLGQTQDGTLYIAMEFIEGPSLAEVIHKSGPVPTSRTIYILRQIASALSLAHKHNIIHRDLKPHNLMLATNADGHEVAKLLDFGIAKTFEEGTHLTKTGLVVGTPQYMAPDQAAGRPIDARSDIYSLGVILYEMLSGEVPFNAETALAVLFKHMTEPPPVPSVRFPHLTISPALEAIALRCLEKEPDKRFQTADEFGAALDAVAIVSASPSPGVGDASAHNIVPIARPGTPTPARATPKPASTSQLAPTVPMRPMASPARPTAAVQASQPLPSPTVGTRPTVPAVGADHVASAAADAAAQEAPPARRSNSRVLVFAAAAVFLFALGVVALQHGYVNWPTKTAPVSVADVPVATPASATSSGGTLQPPPIPSPTESTAASASASTAQQKTPGGASSIAAPSPAAPNETSTPTGGVASVSALPPTAAPPTRAARVVPAGPAAPVAGAALSPAPGPVAPIAGASGTKPPRPDVGTARADPTAEAIRIASAKADAKLYDQALADLKSALSSNPSSASAPSAYLLIGNIYEGQQRIEDAMANYVELRSKFGSIPEDAEATFRLANLTLRSKRGDRERAAMALFEEVVKLQPMSPWAPRALVQKAELEERTKLRAVDTQLGMSVPASLLSYRLLAEKYPGSEGADASLAKLADMYEDIKRYELAAQTLEQLAARFPDNRRDAAWRAAEIYEKRLKDMAKARAAYALVPPRSGRYKDAQKRAQR